jgi:hypothetical protein
MNSTEARDLLERAAASVTPAETDPAARMVRLGRRSVRRRRAWGAAGLVAAAVAAVVVLPLALAPPDRTHPAGPSIVHFGGLTVAVPDGWRTNRVAAFDPCTAEPHTVYLAGRWQLGSSGGRPSAGPAPAPTTCHAGDQAWIAIVQKGDSPSVNPERLVVNDGQPLQAERPDQYELPFVWSYRDLSPVIQATTAFIAGDEPGRARLLQRVTWPAGPPSPPGGGLALPDRITSATSTVLPSNGMVVATDAKTLNRIRTKLAALRDPVPAGQECTLQTPGSVGISLGEVTVVLGDATCPQAISTGGGRVRIPAGLGEELRDLIATSQ